MDKGKRNNKKDTAVTKAVPEIPVKVTVEVVIRHDYPQTGQEQPRRNAKELQAADECPDNRFSYSIETDQATVLLLRVDGYKTDRPGSSGAFTTCINDPSPQPSVRVIALATEINPGGRASLSLKFNGKNVMPYPMEFLRGDNGILTIHELVKLPV